MTAASGATVAGRILILHWGDSGYDALRAVARLSGDELRALGYEVEEFLLFRPGWDAELLQLLTSRSYLFALTLSGIGIEFICQQDGRTRSLWEATRVPLFNWSCDHPCHFPTRHMVRNPFILHGYVFPDHARYMAEQLDPNGLAFAVHLGMPRRDLFRGAPLQLSQRNGRILFAKGSQGNPETLRDEWRRLPEPLSAIVLATAETLLASDGCAILPILQQVAEPWGLFLDGANSLTLQLISSLDFYLRACRAHAVVRAALPFPVDVCGAGWELIDFSGAAARCLGNYPIGPAAPAQVPFYLGCLSTNPVVQESVHDRVFFGLAAGIVPLSEANGFTRAQLPMLAPYSFGFAEDSVAIALTAVLEHPATALEHAEATYQALQPVFTLRESMRRIVAFSSLVTLNSRVGSEPAPGSS